MSGLPGEDEAQTIVNAIIGAMHLCVCAEGVETQAAFEFLADLKCDRAQSFLISPATSAAESLCKKVQSIKGRATRVFQV